MEIFNKDCLVLDADVKTQKEAFELIAKTAKKLGIVSDAKNLVNGLIKRERVSTTGMKRSFAIPHAMNADIKKPAIIAVRFKQGVDWKAFDKKPVKFAIALLIPKKNLSDLHMEYLARISTALMDETICKRLLTTKNKKDVYDIIATAIDVDNKDISTIKASTKRAKAEKADAKADHTGSRPLIIGVTACATGIAHTFMAREALEKCSDKLGYEIHIETQGQNGREHALSDDLIKRAEVVIIAADISVDTEMFADKKIYFCDTNAAINNPERTIKNALSHATVGGQTNTKTAPATSAGTNNGMEFKASGKKFDKFMKPFLSGVSHMIPVLVFSGIVYALLNAINMALPEGSTGNDQGTAMWYAMQAANAGFALFTGIMGAYIAEAIGGRPAFAPGLIATFVAGSSNLYYYYPGIPKEFPNPNSGGDPISNVSLGIFAAIMMGFAAGYLVKWVNSWKIKPIFRTVMSIIFIPVVATSVLVFPFVFLLSGILGCFMNGFAYGLAYAGSIKGVNFLIGFILGAMVGVDMGGPINKIAVATGTCLIQVDPRLMGACAAAIPVAPLGCGLATLLFRKVFNDDERKIGITALALGSMGISEGAIPMFSKNPKQTMIANIVGSAVAGGLAFCFFCGGHVAMWGGPLIALFLGVYADPGSIEVNIPAVFGGHDINSPLKYVSILWYFLAIATGTLVQMFVYASLIGRDRGFRMCMLPNKRPTKIKR